MNIKRTISLATISISIMLAGSVFADSYFLVSSHWGKKQERAVANLGGTVTWSHGPTGIGLVDSDAADFLDRARANKAFRSADIDRVVQWQQPIQNVDANVIDPGLEGAYPFQWHLPAIGADDAWAAGCTGAGVRIAILDGGIFDAHPDLAPNMDVGASASFVPGFAFNEDVGIFWHGTHVAGIAAAANNGGGVLGVAPESTIIGVKVLHDGSGSLGGIFGGIAHAVDVADADIINMSLGASFPKSDPGAGRFAAALNKLMNYAARNGVLVVSSAGNDAFNWDHSWEWIKVPAESGNGIAISATGPEGWAFGAENYDRPASYTSHGHSLVHVSAPGGDFALWPNDGWWYDMVLSTCRGSDADGSFCWAAGTSMAAPAAAGVAALIKANYPGMSVGALKNALANSAVDAGAPGHDIYHGRGWVNALNACNWVPPVE